MSNITTHVLDLTTGKPATEIDAVLFYFKENSEWEKISSGITDKDGRISDLVKSGSVKIETGIYKIRFETGKYFEENNLKGFYPFVEITFNIKEDRHFHVPLLLSPYGYSTYRGS